MKQYISPETERIAIHSEHFFAMSLHDEVGDEQLGKGATFKEIGDEELPQGPDVWGE